MQGKIKVFFEKKRKFGEEKKRRRDWLFRMQVIFWTLSLAPFYIPSYPAAAFWLAIASSEFQEESEGEKREGKGRQYQVLKREHSHSTALQSLPNFWNFTLYLHVMVTACVWTATAAPINMRLCVCGMFVHMLGEMFDECRRLWVFFHRNKEQSPAYVFHIFRAAHAHAYICSYSCGFMHLNAKESLPFCSMCALRGIIIKSQTYKRKVV